MPRGMVGLKSYFEPKAGKTYYYHRKSGTRIVSEFGTAEFAVEFNRIDKAYKARMSTEGTFGALIDKYRASPNFERLKPITKKDYDRVFLYLSTMRDAPITEFKQDMVYEIRDLAFKKHKRRFANYVVQVISIVFNFGIKRGHTTINPAANVDKIFRATGERHRNRPWTSTERDAMLAAAPIQIKAPLAFMRYLGARLGDVRVMENSAYQDGEITFRTGKGDVEVSIPCPAPLADILEKRLPHPKFMFCSTDGGPWTDGGWNASFRKLRAKLEADGRVKPGLTAHGLRHSVATDLRELGKTDRQIADILGQRTTYATPVYHRSADMKRSNAKTMKDLHGPKEAPSL